MEDRDQGSWKRALALANNWFRRRADRLTSEVREDLAQETALQLWRFVQRHGKATPQYAVLVTIAHRLRWRAVRCGLRRIDRVAERDSASWANPEPGSEPMFLVAGRRVPRSYLLRELEFALAQLHATNRSILMAFYEGFSCSEIGERFQLTEEAVKVRLHRTRTRLKERLEGSARAASHFEVGT